MDNTLRIWESRLEDALPIWRAAANRRRVTLIVSALFRTHIFLEPVLAALKADASLSQADRQEAVRMAKAEGSPTRSHLNALAWPLVDPDREDKNTDTALALRLIHVAVKEEPEDLMFLDTLAWALFENALYAEAIAASEKALGIAPEAEKSNYQGYLDRLKKMIAEAKDD
jgi:tetratricopeptide (TPR) repeat protein